MQLLDAIKAVDAAVGYGPPFNIVVLTNQNTVAQMSFTPIN